MSKTSQNRKLAIGRLRDHAIARKTKIKRRSFLKKAGLVSVLVGGGLVWRAFDRGVFSVAKGTAYEPWHDWQTYEGKEPLTLVSAALLAANPHNTQPWLFQVSDSRIDLFADTKRQIGTTDPFLREMHIMTILDNLGKTSRSIGQQKQLSAIANNLKIVVICFRSLCLGKFLGSIAS